MSVTSKGEASETAEMALPPSLRLLKWLVILLTASLIGGVIAMVWLLVTRLPNPGAVKDPASLLPQGFPALDLPAGVTPRAVTLGEGWVAVVTSDDHIRIFGLDGTPWQDVAIARPAQ